MATRWRHPNLDTLLHQDIFTAEELASLLGMSVYVVQHAVHEGELKATIVDHHILCIRREDALEWLKSWR